MKKYTGWFKNLSRTKKVLLILALLIIIVAIMVAAGNSTDLTTKPTSTVSDLDKSISVKSVESNPDGYKGKVIQLTGKIFNLQKDGDLTVVQVWTDPEKSEGNFIISARNAPALAEDDYIKVIGEVRGVYKGENAFSANLSIPAITGLQLTKIDRNEAVAPALTTTAPNKTITQNGISVTLTSIEYAKDETRLKVTVTNSSGDKISFYSFNTKVVQNGSQIKDKTIYDSKTDYDIPSDILDSTSEKGILFFEKADPHKPLAVHFEAYSNKDYNTLNFDFNL